MKKFIFLLNLTIYFIVFFLLISAIGTFILKKPFLMTVIRSNSMYPLFQRGDIILISNVNSNDNIELGDIILFKTEFGVLSNKGVIMHRIVAGNDTEGYITKGDANQDTDQALGNTDKITRNLILGKAITLGGNLIKIPFLGYLALWAEGLKSNKYFISFSILIITAILGAEELLIKKNSIKKKNLNLHYLYILSGITVSILMAVNMLATSRFISVEYEVTETSNGVISNSTIGILKVGDIIERPLVQLSNRTVLPSIITISCKNSQVSFNSNMLVLRKGDLININFRVSANNTGIYKSSIIVGTFLPFLPRSIIYFLASKSFWIALFVICLIPGLPLMLYPLFSRRLRRCIVRDIRKLKFFRPLIS